MKAPAAAALIAADDYAIRFRRRVKIDGRVMRIGEVLVLRGPGCLRMAAGMCRNSQARPANALTERDVALFEALLATGARGTDQ